jgi:hypothetical protein
MLWLLIRYENSLRLVATAWCVSSLLLFLGAKLALFTQNGFFNNKSAIIRCLVIDFVRLVWMSLVILGALFFITNQLNISGYNNVKQLVWLGVIFILSLAVQVLGLGGLMKDLINWVVVYRKYRSDKAILNKASR